MTHTALRRSIRYLVLAALAIGLLSIPVPHKTLAAGRLMTETVDFKVLMEAGIAAKLGISIDQIEAALNAQEKKDHPEVVVENETADPAAIQFLTTITETPEGATKITEDVKGPCVANGEATETKVETNPANVIADIVAAEKDLDKSITICQ